MHATTHSRIADIAVAQWNALVPADAPFLRHEFLAALEDTGCIGAATGWRPEYLCLRDAGGELLGAVPLFRKTHSYGEYIFDWAWARAYQTHGYRYYPKLIAAAPFTPITAPKLLVRPGDPTLTERLMDATLTHAEGTQVSSLHWLFTDRADTERLTGRQLMSRAGTQFHWHNDGYADFDAYLARFASAKRKKLRRERRRVAEAGLVFEHCEGAALTDRDWHDFYRFYLATIEVHGAIAYLSADFFVELGRRLAPHCLLIFARDRRQRVAGALFLKGADALYGRYWGATAWYQDLHFEICYYQPIAYCIEHGIARFEAGAQGEHKLARGLTPVTTYSAHWIRHPAFAAAIAEFLDAERRGVADYQAALNLHVPLRQGADTDTPNAVNWAAR